MFLISDLDMESADSDMEVASVLAADFVQTTGRQEANLSRNHSQPSTVLTNMTRGNWETTTSVGLAEPDIFQLAALGEISQLLEKVKGVHVDITDSHGLTALMWASAYGQLDAVQMLLSQGANVLCCGHCGETALMLCMANGYAQIGLLLLQAGCDVDVCDKLSNTALMHAVYKNHAACVSLLLKWGADITVTNDDGQTAISIAVKLGYRKVQYVIDQHLRESLEPT